MYAALNKGINPFQAVNTLVHSINNEKDFIAVGLYEDGVLTGFITGNAFGTDSYYFACLYMETKGNPNIVKLIDYSIDFVQNTLGYKSWILDANNENMASMAEKYGAVMDSIRYKKVF